MAQFESGNIFIRTMELPEVGDSIQGHTHNFDHTTIIFQGSVHIRAVLPDGSIREADFATPDFFLVKKDVVHEFTATSPNTVLWCVYSHRNPQGEVVQKSENWFPGIS